MTFTQDTERRQTKQTHNTENYKNEQHTDLTKNPVVNPDFPKGRQFRGFFFIRHSKCYSYSQFR